VLKLIPVFTPRSGMSVQECHDYLRLRHARLCASVPSFNRHMCKYVQNFAIEGTISAAGASFGGAAECWFYSIEAFEQAFAEPSYAKFREDEQRFGDLTRLMLVPAEPTQVFGPDDPPRLKVMRFMNFREGVDRGEAWQFWVADYAREAVHDKRLRLAATSYVQNRPLSGVDHSFPTLLTCDAAEEFWLSHRDWWPEFVAAEQDLRERTGYDDLFAVDTRVEFLAESKSVWEVGQDPADALPALEPQLIPSAGQGTGISRKD